ncbi:MAG: hypothetical protein PHS79_00505 [Patescibacteria group bacterium]|nr:hypothetical protein [Patescibacteria group bacterium]
MTLEMMPLETPKQKTLRLPKVKVEKSDYENWKEMSRESFDIFGQQANDIYEIYSEIVKWLESPFAEDDFESHTDRREWYKYLDRTDPAQSMKMQNSKFRNNRITPLFIMYQILQKLLQKSHAETMPSDLFPPHNQDMKKLGTTTISKEERKTIIKKWEKNFAGIARFIEDCAGKEKMAA